MEPAPVTGDKSILMAYPRLGRTNRRFNAVWETTALPRPCSEFLAFCGAYQVSGQTVGDE